MRRMRRMRHNVTQNLDGYPLTNIPSTNTTNPLDCLVRNHECIERSAQSPLRWSSRAISGDINWRETIVALVTPTPIPIPIPSPHRALGVVNCVVHREVI